MEVSVERLRRRKVLDITGRVLGRIGRMLVDTESWAIGKFELRLRRATAQELGLNWSIFRIPVLEVPTGLVMAASDEIILRASLQDLQPLAPEEHTSPRLVTQTAH